MCGFLKICAELSRAARLTAWVGPRGVQASENNPEVLVRSNLRAVPVRRETTELRSFARPSSLCAWNSAMEYAPQSSKEAKCSATDSFLTAGPRKIRDSCQGHRTCSVSLLSLLLLHKLITPLLRLTTAWIPSGGLESGRRNRLKFEGVIQCDGDPELPNDLSKLWGPLPRSLPPEIRSPNSSWLQARETWTPIDQGMDQ